jgi:hypothetical protein
MERPSRYIRDNRHFSQDEPLRRLASVRRESEASPAKLRCFCGLEHLFDADDAIIQTITCPCGQVWKIKSNMNDADEDPPRDQPASFAAVMNQPPKGSDNIGLPSEVSLMNTLIVRAHHAVQRWRASKHHNDFDKEIGRLEAESLTAPLSIEQDGEVFRALIHAIYEGKGGAFRNRQPLIDIVQRADGPQ